MERDTVDLDDLDQVEPAIRRLAEAIRAAGGRACLVGGFVRDLLLRRQAGRDGLPEEAAFDIEVYRLAPDRLVEILRRIGRVNLVGESFAVYKVTPRGGGAGARPELDVSLPRRDQRVTAGHRGFAVEGDPDLPIEEAARRRDFTINAVLLDPLS